MSYVALANITLGSSASSVTFSSIPNTFRDLVIVFNGGVVSGASNMRLTLNSDTTDGNYGGVRMDGTGSATESGVLSGGQARFINYYGYLEANNNCVIVTQIMDYSATNKWKTYLSRANNSGNGVSAITSLWGNTAAVNSVMLDGGTFRTGSTFALYGIAS